MNKLLDRLNNNKMCLIASIPENNYEIAKAAWEAGADAVKVHINVWHRASNNTFGTLEQNQEVYNSAIESAIKAEIEYRKLLEETNNIKNKYLNAISECESVKRQYASRMKQLMKQKNRKWVVI